MSCVLPPETLDLIIDHLHDERAALKTCCIVSKSWVPRTRSHLFACVELNASKSHMARWKKTFPDPFNSPACYTSTLCISDLPTPTVTDTDVGIWIRTFCNVVHLELSSVGLTALVLLYELSPTVRSLRLTHSTTEVFDLICSFPLLEDLELITPASERDTGSWNIPSTSPKLTGTLALRTLGTTTLITRRLLDLPGGLHFSKIDAMFFEDEAESVKDLVLACSDTLESLSTLCCPSYVGTPILVPLDLSTATKLKHVKFLRTRMNSGVQWITTTLQTVKSKNLQHITINQIGPFPGTIGEEIHRGWKDLDQLLVRFWSSHSIRPQVVYMVGNGGELRDLLPSLWPELTRRGLVDLIEVS